MSVRDKTSIYMRMNADPEKDYNFTVPPTSKVSSLFAVFDTLPVVLSPYYFYDPRPEGFGVSVHPGFLTAEGSMLFTHDADYDEHVRPLDLDGTFKDQVLDEQLIVPIFHFNYRRYLGVIAALTFWLYLDLPEHISPTPGFAPTTLLTKAIYYVVPTLKEAPGATDGFDTDFWRWTFFGFHALKCLIIFGLFRIGVINPRSLDPRKKTEGPQVGDLTAEKLQALGWTGVRRAPPDEFMIKHRDYVIKKAGSVLRAHTEGAFTYKDGIELKDGEGWSVYKKGVSKSLRKTDTKFLNSEGKFVVSDDYLNAVAEHAYKEWLKVRDEGVDQLDDFAKSLLRYGFMDGPDSLRALYREIVDSRKKIA